MNKHLLQGHVLNNESWYIYSKAFQHLTFQRDLFSNYKSIPTRPSTWALWVQSHNMSHNKYNQCFNFSRLKVVI